MESWRRNGALAVMTMIACLVVIAGCGSSSDSTSSSSHGESGGPLKNVGTLRISGSDGRTIAVNFQLGPLLYSDEGTPPKAVLKACGASSAAAVRKTVFSKGKMTVDLVKGPSITDYRLSPTEFVTGDGWNGETAIQVGTSWKCEETGEVLLKRKQQPQTFRFWVLSQVLSGGQRHVPKSELDTWRFGEFPVLPDSVFHATGPGASVCPAEGHDREHVMLYGRPPFKISGPTGGPMVCRSAEN
jgi:hypothetical protein